MAVPVPAGREAHSAHLHFQLSLYNFANANLNGNSECWLDDWLLAMAGWPDIEYDCAMRMRS